MSPVKSECMNTSSATRFVAIANYLGKSDEVGTVDLVEVTPTRDVGDRTAHLAIRGLVEFLP